MNRIAQHFVKVFVNSFTKGPFDLERAKKALMYPVFLPENAQKVMDEAAKQGKLETEICGLYLLQLARSGDMQQVQKGMDWVAKHNIHDRSGWKDVHVQLHAAQKDIPKSLSLLDSIDKSQLRLKSLRFLVESMGDSNSMIERFLAIWNEKKAEEPKASHLIMGNLFMKKLLEIGETELAVNMLQATSREHGSDYFTYYYLVTASAMQENMEGVEFWMKCMEQQGLSPEYEIYEMALLPIALADDRELAIKWMQEKIPPKIITQLHIPLVATKGDIQKGLFWVDLARQRGTKSLRPFYGTLFDVAKKEKNVEAERFWYSKLRSLSISRNDIVALNV